MRRVVLASVLVAAAAAGQSSSSREQQRAFEEYQKILSAQREFGELNGFGDPPWSGAGYVAKLSPRSRASFVSVTTLAAPKKARKAFLEAERSLLRSPQQIEKAEEALLQAVELYPEYAVAWSLLGKIRLAKGERRDARESLLRATAADAAFVEPHADLARLSLEDHDWPALEQSARRILRANPHFTLGHLYLGVAFFNQGAVDGAERHALDALATDDAKLFPETLHLLGQIYERRGDHGKAADCFRRYVAESNPPEPWRGALHDHILALETR